jgi:hypothetical protein
VIISPTDVTVRPLAARGTLVDEAAIDRPPLAQHPLVPEAQLELEIYGCTIGRQRIDLDPVRPEAAERMVQVADGASVMTPLPQGRGSSA